MRAPLYLFFMAIPLVFSVFILYHFFGYDLILNVLTGRIVQDQWVSGNITAKAYLIQRVALGSFRIGIPMLTAIPFALITKKQDRPQFAPNFNLLVPENPAKEYTQHSALINQPDWDSMDSTLIEKGKPDTEQKSANSQLNNLSPARTASSHSQFSIVNSPLNKPFSIVNRTQCPTRRSRPSPNFLLTTLHCCVATYFALPLLLWGSSIDRHQIGFLPLAVPIIAIGLSRLQKVRIPVLWLMFFYNILFLFYSVLENTIEMQYLVYWGKQLHVLVRKVVRACVFGSGRCCFFAWSSCLLPCGICLYKCHLALIAMTTSWPHHQRKPQGRHGEGRGLDY